MGDMLIPFFWKKKIEAASYDVMYCGNTQAASAVAPDVYADRQIELMQKICMPRTFDVSDGESEVEDGSQVMEGHNSGRSCACYRRRRGYAASDVSEEICADDDDR